MLVSVPSDVFSQAIQQAAQAAASRDALPALTGVLLEANDQEQTLTLTASDLDISFTISLSAEVQVKGRLLVPAKQLAELAKRLPEDVILIQGREDSLHLEWQQSEADLPCLPAGDFPYPEFAVEGSSFKIPLSEWQRQVSRTVYAAARDESRPVLTGVCLDVQPDQVAFVATDNFRLAWSCLKLSELPKGMFVLPARTLSTLSRMWHGDGELVVTLGSRAVGFSCLGSRLTVRVLEGQFPDYRRILPESYASTLAINRFSFLEIVERAALVTQGSGAPQMRLSISDNGCQVHAESQIGGRLREGLPATVKGEPLEISFQPRFVMDALRSIDSDQVVLEFLGELRPARLRPLTETDHFSILLPLRTMA